jgi:hypothetical protein
VAAACALGLVGAWLAARLTEHTRIGLFLCSTLASAPLVAFLIALVRSRRRARPAAKAGVLVSSRRLPARADLLGLGLLLGAACLLLHQSLLFGKGLVPADGVADYQPWRSELGRSASNRLLADQFLTLIPQQQFLHDQIVRGEFPLWNPHLACGVPNVASMQSAPFFPLNLLLLPLDPFASRGVAALLKLVLAGLFTHFFMRRLGASPSAATLAAVAFAFSGFMIVWLGHPQTNTAMWLPLLLLLIESEFSSSAGDRSARAPGRARHWIGFAAAYGAMLLGGHPPTIVHVSACAGAYFAFRLASSRGEGKAARRLGRFCVALAGGALLGAVQLVPFLEYTPLSSVAASSAALDRSSAQLPLQALVYFLLPYVSGSPVAGFEHLAGQLGLLRVHNFHARTGFFGVVALYLALLGLLLRRDRPAVLFAALALACLCVIFGAPPLPSLLGALPVLRDIDHTRLLLIVGLCGAVLGGFGLDRIREAGGERRRVAAFVVTWLAAAVLLGALWVRLSPSLRQGAGFEFVLRQYGVFLAALLAVTVATLWRERARLATALCLVGLSLEMLCFAYDYNPSIPRSAYYPETPGIRALRQDASPSRIIGLGRVLPANTAMLFGLHDVRGRDFMTVRSYEELIRGEAGDFHFMHWISELPASVLALNIEYVVVPEGAELPEARFERIHRGGISIYRLRPTVERALILREVEVVSDRRELLSRVRSGGFDARDLLLLEEPPAPLPEGEGGDSSRAEDSLRITEYQPDRVTLEATLEAPGFLLLLDTYFPGWKAHVGGRPAQIYRADYNFRAVALPAGPSQVVFEYRPASVAVGLSLSLMSGAALLALLCFDRPALPGTRSEES